MLTADFVRKTIMNENSDEKLDQIIKSIDEEIEKRAKSGVEYWRFRKALITTK